MTRSTSLLSDPFTTTTSTTTTTEKEGRELKKNDSIPAVPEFSMPQSSSADSTGSNQTALTQNGRFKIVFKGVVDQLPQTASSPLPHPPSPSAPTNTSNAIPSSSRSLSPDSDLPFALSAPPVPSTTNLALMEEDEGEPPLKKGKKSKKSKRAGGKKEKVKKDKKESKLSSTAIAEVVGEAGAREEEEPTVIASTSSSATPSGSGSGLNRVCHHHKSLTKGEVRMTCRNNPECRTIWCQSCIEKYYIDCTPEKVFINDTTFECPVCLDRCKCAGCKKKRKEIAKELKSQSKKKNSSMRGTPRATSVANSNSTTATTMTTRRSNTPAGNVVPVEAIGEGLEKVKMEEVEEENQIVPLPAQLPPPPSTATRRPSFPTTVPSDPLAAPNAMIDPSLLPPPSSDSTFNSSTPTAFPLQSPVPTASGILKIRVKPPKRPRTEKGTFVPLPSPVPSSDPSYVPHHYVAPPEPTSYPYVAVPPSRRGGRGGNRRGAGRRSAAATIQANEGTSGPGSGTSFFGRPPSLGQQQVIGGVRPKRTKKVSSQYDDFAVEGVPAFGTTPPPGEGAEEENVGGGRWGGNRRGGRTRRTTTNTLDSPFDQPSASTSTTVTRSASLQLPTAGGSILIGPDGKRRRPRLSGLSSASSCSSISSSGDIMDEDEEFEGSYWAEQAERESDQRVRHWLLVPPSEPQPVLAGLERNLSEGGGEEVGFSPTATTGGDGDVEMGERKRKEKVKWIEGPERRRRRAMALQKMKEEQEGKVSSEEGVKRPLKRSMSWDAGESAGKARENYKHCEPIKPFGDGSSSSSASLPPPSPARKLSLPPPSPAVHKPSSTCSEPTPLQTESPISYSDQPPPYESHFPPSATAPLPTQTQRPPAIVVSPATTASQSPQIPSVPASVSAPSTAPPSRPLSTNSTSLASETDLEADLAARSADDMRLGLRLLDAIRTITGTKLAMEAMGIAPSALPTPTTVPPSPSPSPALAPAPPVVTSPVKSESEESSALSLLISQEHAEYEAIRREERQRLLETALDPEKVFRTEAKGNDAHLLERAPEWGGMDVDSDEAEGRFKEVLVGGGDGMDESMFDFESFLTSGSKGEETSNWNTSIPLSTTNSTSTSSSSAVSSSAPTPAPTHASSDDTMTPSSNLAGSRPTSIPPPETPLKSIFSASHFLAPAVDDHQFWSLHEGGGGAATPTRGLIIESEFDFQIINGAANWIPQDEEVN